MNTTDISNYLAIHTVIKNAKLKGLNSSRFDFKTNKSGIFSVNGAGNDLILVTAQFESNGINRFDTLSSNNKFINRAIEDFERRVYKMASFPVVKVDGRSGKETLIDLFADETVKFCMVASYKNRRLHDLYFSISLVNYNYFFICNEKKIDFRQINFRYNERGLFVSQPQSVHTLLDNFDSNYPGLSIERQNIISIRDVNSMLYL